MKNISKIITLLIIATVLIHFSCEKNGITQDEYQIQYYRKAQLKNVFYNEIYPIHQELLALSNELVIAAESFSANKTNNNIQVLKNSWLATAKKWQNCALYNMGDVKDSFIHFSINQWPTNTNNIETYISNATTINVDFIASLGSSSKGIPALEYLLFNNDTDTTLNSYINSTARTDYLLAISKDLKSNINVLVNLWNNYKDNFINATQNGLTGSQNKLVNAIVSSIENISLNKLNNAIISSNQTQFEAYRSDASLYFIKNNITSLKRCFTGEFQQTPFRVGFDEYLQQLGAETIITDINTAFNNVETKIFVINYLNTSLNNNPEEITELKSAIDELLFLIKTDFAFTIGSTVTFTDNDGD